MDKKHPNLKKLTQEQRQKGARAKTKKKAQAARMNAVKHGKYIKHPELQEKGVFAIRLERAFRSQGLVQAGELTRYLIGSLALTGEQMEIEGMSFDRMMSYTRLLLEVCRAMGLSSSALKNQMEVVRRSQEIMEEESDRELTDGEMLSRVFKVY